LRRMVKPQRYATIPKRFWGIRMRTVVHQWYRYSDMDEKLWSNHCFSSISFYVSVFCRAVYTSHAQILESSMHKIDALIGFQVLKAKEYTSTSSIVN
jgi:hypothetical protein